MQRYLPLYFRLGYSSVIRFESYPISKELSMMYRPDQFLLTGRHKPF